MREKADIHLTEQDWINLAATACEHAGIDYKSIEAITTWHQKFTDSDAYRNNAVFRIDGHRIVKLYGPEQLRQFHVECATLKTLTQAPNIPTPQLIAASERDDKPHYVIMSEVDGTTLQESWDAMSRDDLLDIARQIGTITAAYFRLPKDRLAAVEGQFDTRKNQIEQMQAERKEEIELMNNLSTKQKDQLLDFLYGEALDYMAGPSSLTHSDLSHAHIYVTQDSEQWKVSGIIDWAEAMLGPAEWDTGFHWFWTFSQDKETMRECLKTLYADKGVPDQLARRCFATHMYSFSMNEIWDYLNQEIRESDSVVRQLTEIFFPPDVFGSPD